MSGVPDAPSGPEKTEDRSRVSRSEAEARYHGIMGTVPDLVFILDEAGSIIEANPAASEKLGYPTDELIGRKLRSFLDSGPPVATPADEGARYGRVSGTRAVLRAKDGTAIPVEIWTSARFSSIGEVSGSLTIARLTDRPADQPQQLGSAQRMFETVSRAMKIGVSVHNAAYVVTYQNEFLRECYPNALGDKCYRVYRGLAGPCENCIVRRAMATGETLREIVAGQSPDGRRVYFEMIGVPVIDEAGRTTGGFEIIRDISDVKAEIERMLQFDRAAEKAETAAISGEVSQPLAGISGYSELLRKSVEEGNPAYRYATKIYEQSQRLSDLIRKINSVRTIQSDDGAKSD